MISFADANNRLHEQGYAIFDLPDSDVIHVVSELLQAELKRVTGIPGITLESYHQYFEDDARHRAIHYKIGKFAKDSNFSVRILKQNMDLFRQMIGPDICIAIDTNYRIARPNKLQDNVGYHRDADLGHTAYELNVHVPYVDLNSDGALAVLPNSHLMNRNHFQFSKVPQEDVKKGSKLHWLGYFYEQFKYAQDFEDDLVRPEIKKGQILINSTSVMHGQLVNNSNVTRWTSDFLTCNALAPVSWIHKGNKERYFVVSQSYAGKAGRAFDEPEFPRASQRRNIIDT